MNEEIGLAADVEDILQDSLEIFGGDPVSAEDGTVRYGPLALTVSPKEGKANTLLADHLFSPALIIAEHIERGLIALGDETVLELGAGAALPSLLTSMLPEPHTPALVVVTDYPDPTIVGNLERNVARNAALAAPGCRVAWRGHEWGAPLADLLALLAPPATGYTAVILSDLLHFDASHGALLASLTALLARTPHARTYVGAGTYTPVRVCDAWLALSRAAGLEWEEIELRGEEGAWKGAMEVIWSGRRMSEEALGERKGMCRLWVGRWGAEALEAGA